jgi:3,4-dihydroxy 2-butanone 4-phosphate synthase/GTP cyclohydrolase II
METLSVERLTSTRIPTVDGEFRLCLYANSHDDEDHLALVYGDVEGEDDVLVRVHSECFTGDVLGSLRCDCGEQLNTSMRRVAAQGRGVILYLRQEGRGIGLHSKLQAYDLQDEGYDTVEANLMLGHGADERDYTIGASMLHDLGVASIRLLTNNPAKVESLRQHGVRVSERVPLEPHLNRHNTDYLRTKVDRMRHMLDLGPLNGGARTNAHGSDLQALRERALDHFRTTERPFVTLTYAQSLDGSIATADGQPLLLSGEASMDMTHELRATHDGILVGIGTVLSDNPRLTVRRTDGQHPRPVVLDSRLRFPPDARMLQTDGPPPLIATHADAPEDAQHALEDAGATVLRLPCTATGICFDALLDALAECSIRSVMVEGGAEVIRNVLRQQRADHLILTVAPTFVGGLPALGMPSDGTGDGAIPDATFPELTNIQYRWLGQDLVLQGDPVWPEASSDASSDAK